MSPHPFFDETDLVRPERTARPFRWWGVFIVAFAVFLSAYLLVFDGWRAVSKPATSPGDLQRQKVQRFLSRENVDAVIVGTSLSNKMRDGLFRHAEVSNLALPGGSFLTGLEIVARSNRRPRLVLAEINLMERALDEGLVSAFGELPQPLDRLRLVLRDLKPIRSVLADFFGVHPDARFMLKHEPAAGGNPAAEDAFATTVPAGQNNRLVSETRKLFDKLATDGTVVAKAEENFSRALRLAGELEERGTKVRFVLLPIAPDLSGHAYVESIVQIAKRKMSPDEFAMLEVPVDPQPLAWMDGMHLDNRSSLAYSRALENAFPELRGERQLPSDRAGDIIEP